MKVNDMHVTLEKYKIEWVKIECTLMSITNFLVNSLMGTVFLKLIHSSGNFKDMEKLFSMLDEIIEEIGEEIVMQVITDSASTYMSVGRIIDGKEKIFVLDSMCCTCNEFDTRRYC
jgi:Protein of unknown function (DUF 659)